MRWTKLLSGKANPPTFEQSVLKKSICKLTALKIIAVCFLQSEVRDDVLRAVPVNASCDKISADRVGRSLSYGYVKAFKISRPRISAS